MQGYRRIPYMYRIRIRILVNTSSDEYCVAENGRL